MPCLLLVFDAVPYLSPALQGQEPMPFGYAPIAYRIQQFLARHHYEWAPDDNYPACNIYKRLESASVRAEGDANNNANGAYERISARMDYKARQEAASRKRRREVEARRATLLAIPEQQEEEGEDDMPPPPPRKRARPDDVGMALPAASSLSRPFDPMPIDDDGEEEEEEEEEIDAMDIDALTAYMSPRPGHLF